MTSTEESSSTPLLKSAEEGNFEKPRSQTVKHVFLGIIATLPSLAPGMCLGFSAVTLPQLNFNIDDSTWFASIIALAIPVGAVVSYHIMNRYGRRPALLTINIVGLLGWLMLSFQPTAPTLAKLYIGRFLTGLSVGFASTPAAIYASECLAVDSELKQVISTWSTVALSLGILIVYISGSLIPYYQVAGFAAIISIIAFVVVAIFIPESPTWLQSKGRQGDAEWVTKQLGVSPKPPTETEPSSSSQPTSGETSAKEINADFTTKLKETLNELEKPEAYKPLLIMIAFFFFQQFSGVHVLIMYMVDVVRTAGVVALNPYFVAVMSGTIILFVSVFASFLYPKTGVRAIAVISGSGMAASMLFIAVYLTLRPYFLTRVEYYYLRWIPLLAVLLNVTSSTIGFLILPWSMLGEIFPLNVKGIAANIAITVGYIFCFIAVKSFPYLWLSLGNGGVFYFFGIVALSGTLFVYYFLPETNGKTLDEILESFSKSKI
ncbi:trehalose transporter 1-like protein [Lycorma delicatula]|uniref:trehalose transporter 1-like protein n=1 Tax=Lycorma delicatula TaxID=130591 RepID=UPI003F5118DC